MDIASGSYANDRFACTVGAAFGFGRVDTLRVRYDRGEDAAKSLLKSKNAMYQYAQLHIFGHPLRSNISSLSDESSNQSSPISHNAHNTSQKLFRSET